MLSFGGQTDDFNFVSVNVNEKQPNTLEQDSATILSGLAKEHRVHLDGVHISRQNFEICTEMVCGIRGHSHDALRQRIWWHQIVNQARQPTHVLTVSYQDQLSNVLMRLTIGNTFENLIQWRDPLKTGILTVVVLTLLVSLSCLSFISVLAYAGLALLCCTFAARLYHFILPSTPKTVDKPGTPASHDVLTDGFEEHSAIIFQLQPRVSMLSPRRELLKELNYSSTCCGPLHPNAENSHSIKYIISYHIDVRYRWRGSTTTSRSFLDTDHSLVRYCYSLRFSGLNKKRMPSLAIRKLVDPEIKRTYRNPLHERLPDGPMSDINGQWEKICKALPKNGTSVCEVYEHNPTPIFTYFWACDDVCGSRERCPLSPSLFNFVTDELMRRTLGGLQKPVVQIVEDENLVDLDYADAIALIFEDQGETQALLSRLTTVILSFGMRLTRSKCKVKLENVQSMNMSPYNSLRINGGCEDFYRPRLVVRSTFPFSGDRNCSSWNQRAYGTRFIADKLIGPPPALGWRHSKKWRLIDVNLPECLTRILQQASTRNEVHDEQINTSFMRLNANLTPSDTINASKVSAARNRKMHRILFREFSTLARYQRFNVFHATNRENRLK
ncbi:reticulon/nogo [Clonorchis sinensis]|uniref:Reticulon-like protein n=1 Tax=Clonorchis sinensis TaxID=79923 RepID=G7YQ54_CLOSI|nr:reticulon/nogo [Clonorchis sinensis]